MKKSLNSILLILLLLISANILYLRARGVNPTQFHPAIVYGLLIINALWFLWELRTKKGRS